MRLYDCCISIKLFNAAMLGLLVLFSSFSVVDSPIDQDNKDNSMEDINPEDQSHGLVDSSYCLWCLAGVSLAGLVWLMVCQLRF